VATEFVLIRIRFNQSEYDSGAQRG